MLTRDEHFQRLNSIWDTQEWKEKRFNFKKLIGQKWEITEAIYMEFLEVLPPVCFDGDSFYMSELLSGNITSRYSTEDNKYFHEYALMPTAGLEAIGY